VFPLGQLADGGRRVLRGRAFDQLAVVGAPPGEELGYGLAPLIAILARPKEVSLVDLDCEQMKSTPLLPFLARSAPFAFAQLGASAFLIAAQRAAIPLARRRPRQRSAERTVLRKLVYLLPAVGTTSEVGGAVTHSHEVIRALTDEGVAVEPFTTNAAIARTAQREPDSPCQWRLVRNPRIAKAIAASAAAGGDVALVRAALAAARDADAIYQRHGRFSIAGAILARLSRKPLILEYNGSEEFVERHWMSTRTPLRSRIRLCEEATLAAAARIVVVSKVDYEALQERGIESNRLVLNPNGVDAQRFALGGGGAVRRRHHIDPDSLVIGFVGTFGPWHGAPILARAFVDLIPRVPAAHLLLVGEGRELEATVETLRDSGQGASVTVAGRVVPAKVPSYLDACDVLVAPHIPLAGGAEFFGSPTKLFEYMAAGKAIVASRLGQIGEVLEHGVTGWLVAPGDVEDLRLGLLAVADSAELRATLGRNAREQAIEHHSWRLNARRVIAAYASLAGGAA
jgi:glycosyltransferase involved in cell wall biosynthesis